MKPVLYLSLDPAFLPERKGERGGRATETGMGAIEGRGDPGVCGSGRHFFTLARIAVAECGRNRLEEGASFRRRRMWIAAAPDGCNEPVL